MPQVVYNPPLPTDFNSGGGNSTQASIPNVFVTEVQATTTIPELPTKTNLLLSDFLVIQDGANTYKTPLQNILNLFTQYYVTLSYTINGSVTAGSVFSFTSDNIPVISNGSIVSNQFVASANSAYAQSFSNDIGATVTYVNPYMSYTPGIIFNVDSTSTVGNLKLTYSSNGQLSNGDYLLVDNGTNTSEYQINSVNSTAGTTETLNKNNSTFTGVLSNGTILVRFDASAGALSVSSNNGTTWTNTSTGTPNANVTFSCAYGNGVFCFVWLRGSTTYYLTTTNGITYQTAAIGDLNLGTSGLLQLLFVNSEFVFFSFGGSTKYRSSNGSTWLTSSMIGNPATGKFGGVVYDTVNSRYLTIRSPSFIGVADGVIYYSNNGGANWTSAGTPTLGLSVSGTGSSIFMKCINGVLYGTVNSYSPEAGTPVANNFFKTTDYVNLTQLTSPSSLGNSLILDEQTGYLYSFGNTNGVLTGRSTDLLTFTAYPGLNGITNPTMVTVRNSFFYNANSKFFASYIYTITSTTPSINVNVPTWVAKGGQRLQYSVDNGSLDFQSNAAITYNRQNNNIVYNGTPITGTSGSNITLKALNLNAGDALYTFGVQYNISQS